MVDAPLPSGRPALISRGWDFWLLGGASLAVWVVAMTLGPGNQERGGTFLNAMVTLSAVDLLVNQPHLLSSYHLAYFRGKDFILRHWFQTIAVPLALLITMGSALWLLFFPAATTPQAGAIILGVTVNFMFLVSGWHYTKQVFGVTMVYANYDSYPLVRWQRELIRYSLLTLWLYGFAGSTPGSVATESLQFRKWNGMLPGWVSPLTGTLLLFLVLGVLFGVFLRNWPRTRPSLNLVTPYVAIFFWFVPWLRPYAFYQIVPLFHGMQYLVFVYRMERFRYQTLRNAIAWLGLAGLIAISWISFSAIPGHLDTLAQRSANFSFFVVAAATFFNVHHIFLDNALWRIGEDPQVRQALIH